MAKLKAISKMSFVYEGDELKRRAENIIKNYVYESPTFNAPYNASQALHSSDEFNAALKEICDHVGYAPDSSWETINNSPLLKERIAEQVLHTQNRSHTADLARENGLFWPADTHLNTENLKNIDTIPLSNSAAITSEQYTHIQNHQSRVNSRINTLIPHDFNAEMIDENLIALAQKDGRLYPMDLGLLEQYAVEKGIIDSATPKFRFNGVPKAPQSNFLGRYSEKEAKNAITFMTGTHLNSIRGQAMMQELFNMDENRFANSFLKNPYHTKAQYLDTLSNIIQGAPIDQAYLNGINGYLKPGTKPWTQYSLRKAFTKLKEKPEYQEFIRDAEQMMARIDTVKPGDMKAVIAQIGKIQKEEALRVKQYNDKLTEAARNLRRADSPAVGGSLGTETIASEVKPTIIQQPAASTELPLVVEPHEPQNLTPAKEEVKAVMSVAPVIDEDAAIIGRTIDGMKEPTPAIAAANGRDPQTRLKNNMAHKEKKAAGAERKAAAREEAQITLAAKQERAAAYQAAWEKREAAALEKLEQIVQANKKSDAPIEKEAWWKKFVKRKPKPAVAAAKSAHEGAIAALEQHHASPEVEHAFQEIFHLDAKRMEIIKRHQPEFISDIMSHLMQPADKVLAFTQPELRILNEATGIIHTADLSGPRGRLQTGYKPLVERAAELTSKVEKTKTALEKTLLATKRKPFFRIASDEELIETVQAREEKQAAERAAQQAAQVEVPESSFLDMFRSSKQNALRREYRERVATGSGQEVAQEAESWVAKHPTRAGAIAAGGVLAVVAAKKWADRTARPQNTSPENDYLNGRR